MERENNEKEREIVEEMERAIEEVTKYYIALERGDDNPEMTVWGTYEDYIRVVGEATEVVEEVVVDDEYDPEEDPDDPFFLGVDLVTSLKLCNFK